MSLFTAVEMAPRDPILGLNEQFNADTNPKQGEPGRGRVLRRQRQAAPAECVQAAERADDGPVPTARGYLPIDGIAAYDAAVKAWCSAPNSPNAVKSGRVSTVQAIGGTGGLKIGADFLKKISPAAKVLISDPSWENHRGHVHQCRLRSGHLCRTTTRSSARCELRRHAGRPERGRRRHHRGAARLLPQPDRLRHHGRAQWDQVIAAVKAKGLVAFLDMAYQGFGHGIKPKTAP